MVRRFMQEDPTSAWFSIQKLAAMVPPCGTGFQSARCDLVFYTDSDLPVDLSVVADAIEAAQGTDVLVGFQASAL